MISGIYIHIPFCRRRCLYCDFFSVGASRARWNDYVSALIAEFRAGIAGIPICPDTTIYIGGGTPSLIPPDEFMRLSDALRTVVPASPEFTIEVNPDDVSPELARVWRDGGVNRVSMGVQSLVDRELKFIGRRHDSRAAIRAFDVLRSYFDNISLDLMFGLPGQTSKSLEESVRGILRLAPEHVSAYSLMYEERSALTRMRDRGMVREVDDEDSLEMFTLLSDMLTDAGYEQYEISNYARRGFRSRHNSSYWDAAPYLGIGPGAHGYDGNRIRSANAPDIDAYIDYWNHGIGPRPLVEERLTDDELREEAIMTQLRTREGISLAAFARRFGEDAATRLRNSATVWIKRGMMVEKNGTLALTRAGIMISDEIISDLF